MKPAIQVIEQILLEIRRLNFQSFGTAGTTTLDSGTAETPDGLVFHALQATATTVGLSYTDLSLLPGSSTTVVEIDAGSTIYGRFTNVNLTDGSLRAYQMSTQ